MNNSIVTLGISNDLGTARADHDFYATPPFAVEELLEREQFSHDIWECACGQGHISEVLKNHGYNVRSTDLIDRGYGTGCVDFLKTNEVFNGDIVTNPPYNRNNALKFVEKALQTVPEGHRVAMFLRLLFIEGQERRTLFDLQPPARIYLFQSVCMPERMVILRMRKVIRRWRLHGSFGLKEIPSHRNSTGFNESHPT